MIATRFIGVRGNAHHVPDTVSGCRAAERVPKTLLAHGQRTPYGRAGMGEIEKAMEEIMSTNPEFTFRDLCAELVNKGELEYRLYEDPYVHAWLYKRFADVKARVNAGRVNTDI
jgi:hypothetical protein